MKKYLFVFSPGRVDNNKFRYYDTIKNKKCYLGGETRLNSVIKCHEEYKFIVLVGGSSEKIVDMKKRLTYEGINRQKILQIMSKPNTLGNIISIKKFLNNEKCEIGFLSNFYHFNRILTYYYNGDKSIIHPNVVIAEIIMNNYQEISKISLDRIEMECKGVVDFYKNYNLE